MIIEISLTNEYNPDWGMYEGIRELIQNTLDGEKAGYPCTITLNKKGDLVLTNKNAFLPRESLLLGFSTKRNSTENIGGFGEGLKIGVMALLRDGYKISIRNRHETWTPCIQKSEKFNSRVLAFDIRQTKSANQDLIVTVSDIGNEAWESIKQNFLYLTPAKESIRTPYGELIKDKDREGCIFVKGIFIQTYPGIRYGYNFLNIATDHDRRLVSSFDLTWECGKILEHAVCIEELAVSDLYGMINAENKDIADIAYTASKATSESLISEFQKEHGEDAIPVENMAQSRELCHLHITGIPMPSLFRNIYQKQRGDFRQIKQELLDKKAKLWSWNDLTPKEADNLTVVAGMISGFELESLNIADFADENVQGQYRDGKIVISRKCLKDKTVLLATLCHEFLHPEGSDGEHSFHASVETMLAQIAIRNWEAKCT